MDSKKKLVLIGSAGTGKTSLIHRFTRHTFSPSYTSTVGIDFMSKTVYFEDRDPVALQIWDTAGQERFAALLPSYLRECSAAVIVFDITSRASFEDATSKWLQSVKEEQSNQSEPLVVLAANKADLASSREVELSEISSFASTHNIPFFEVSAKLGHNVKELFQNIALLLSKPSSTEVVEENAVVSNKNGDDLLLTPDLSNSNSRGNCRC
ncbi:hypothetical protein P9112_014543 [Eukaryota sp. TZLM1-RC]